MNLKRRCLERTLLGNGCGFLGAIPLQVKIEAKIGMSTLPLSSTFLSIGKLWNPLLVFNYSVPQDHLPPSVYVANHESGLCGEDCLYHLLKESDQWVKLMLKVLSWLKKMRAAWGPAFCPVTEFLV